MRRFVDQFNAVSAKLVRCERTMRAGREECWGSVAMTKAVETGYSNISRLQTWQSDLYRAMQKIALPEDAPMALNCLLAPRDDVAAMRCLALDPTRPHTRIVTAADADTLPLTVGMSGNCTFTVRPDSVMITADHCGRNAIGTGLILRPNRSESVAGVLQASLEGDSVQYYTGRSFEDLAVWRSPGSPRGRPFYMLAQDSEADSGCRIVDDTFVACAPTEYKSLNGQRATVLGFPTLRYNAREKLETIVQSRGDVHYDSYANRIFVHASVSPGSSGGPVYAVGLKIGGLEPDRPVYFGPVTQVNRSRKIQSVLATDTLVVVGAYTLNHLRKILNSARN